jgi:hypothetical protein
MLVVRGTMRRGTTNDVAALAGGVLFGVTANLSYGLVLLAVIPLAVAVYRRHARPILMAILGALPVFVGFALAGFWWLDGLFATRDRYFAGIASRRPYELFVVANLSILAIVLGPAVAVALWRLRERSLWVVVGAALAAVAVADLSGMSKSEVERIWLPFTPFVLVAAAVLVPRRARGSTAAHAGVRTLNASTGAGWLATQAGFAIVLESVVRTAW